MNNLLSIENLSVSFDLDKSTIEVVDSVSFSINQGETVSLVGESGCGKSVTASSIMRLLPFPYGKITNGSIQFEGTNLIDLPIDEMYKIRGASISMIFQEPMTALNPVHTVGKQIKEIFKLHRDNLDVASYDNEVIEILRSVDMPSPEQRIKNYPFQLSGGMRQRVMIAMALAAHPKLLIADEPTTALDVTVQAQILALIKDLQQKNNMGVLYITHDMGVVAEISDYVVVMYAGQVVERGTVDTIFNKPLHPYTIGLINSMPKMNSVPKSKLPSIPGNVPSPANYPSTCRFAGRCIYADDYCKGNRQDLIEFEAGHYVRCHKAGALK